MDNESQEIAESWVTTMNGHNGLHVSGTRQDAYEWKLNVVLHNYIITYKHSHKTLLCAASQFHYWHEWEWEIDFLCFPPRSMYWTVPSLSRAWVAWRQATEDLSVRWVISVTIPVKTIILQSLLQDILLFMNHNNYFLVILVPVGIKCWNYFFY